MDRIAPHFLWVGNDADCRNFRRLFEEGVEAVVQLAAEETAVPVPRDLLYFRVPLHDGTGNSPKILKLAIRSVAELLAAHVPTLVGCSFGLSRSPAIAAAALASAFGAAPDHALLTVRQSHRCDVSPALWHEIRSILAADG